AGAAAIPIPAPHAGRAAPRAAVSIVTERELHVFRRRMAIEELGVIGDPEAASRRLLFERVSEATLAEFVVMAIALAIGRGMHHGALALRSALAALDQVRRRIERTLEGDRSRQ